MFYIMARLEYFEEDAVIALRTTVKLWIDPTGVCLSLVDQWRTENLLPGIHNSSA